MLCALAPLDALANPARRERQPSSLADAPPREVFDFPRWYSPIASQASEVWGNVYGGFRRDVVYTGLLTFGADVDLGKPGWVPGGSLQIVGIGVQGGNISDAVGDAGIISNIAGEPTVRLYKAWYQQQWLGEQVSLKLGLIGVDDDFMRIESAQLFLHSAFGTPLTQAENAAAPIYPLSALGTRLSIEPADSWEILLGAYDGFAGREDENPHVPDLGLSGEQGAMLFGELAWCPKPGNRSLRLTLGGFAHTGVFSDPQTGERQRAIASSYAMLDHTLLRWRGSDVNVFSHAEIAFPLSRVAIAAFGDAGIEVSGGMWKRPRDHLGVAVAWTAFSEAHVLARRARGDPVSVRESVLEVTYRLAALPWIHLQPSAQWIFDPHFSRRDALALGLRLTLQY